LAVYFADVHAPVLERARETGLLGVVAEGHVFATVDLAVREVEAHPVTRPSPPSRGGAREQP
jgi:predicted DNA-binding protein with PD1-like motif